MSKQKSRASVYRHGDKYFVGAMAFFADAPGASSSTIWTVLGSDGAVADADLGAGVMEMLVQSGVLPTAFVGGGEPGRTVMTAALGLVSDSVLESEAVRVSVSLHEGRLIVRASQSLGAGGGFGGSGLPAQELDPDSPPDVVGAAVRQATESAAEVSAAVLMPAGSWRGEQASDVAIPAGGVVTVRRGPGGWSVTARIGARGGESAIASSSVGHVARDGSVAELGRVVVEILRHAQSGDLRPGEESLAGGDRQVLTEADEFGLTIYPQAISTDTGVWDVPAHQDVRTLPRHASVADIGRAVALATEEAEDW